MRTIILNDEKITIRPVSGVKVQFVKGNCIIEEALLSSFKTEEKIEQHKQSLDFDYHIDAYNGNDENWKKIHTELRNINSADRTQKKHLIEEFDNKHKIKFSDVLFYGSLTLADYDKFRQIIPNARIGYGKENEVHSYKCYLGNYDYRSKTIHNIVMCEDLKSAVNSLIRSLNHRNNVILYKKYNETIQEDRQQD